MVLRDNLAGVAQDFFSPDIVQRFSQVLGEPADKTTMGLKAVIPTLLMGIIQKSTTTEGAKTILNLANRQDYSIIDISSAMKNGRGQQGHDFLQRIFGGQVGDVVAKLGASTELSTASVHRMLGMAAPLVMGALGAKIKNENMSADGLMSFLDKQKFALMGLMPQALKGRFAPSMDALTASDMDVIGKSRKTSWFGILLLALTVVAGMSWLFNRDRDNVALREPAAMNQADIPAAMTLAPTMDSLNDFMKSAQASDLPKRFRFEALYFQAGTTDLAPGAEAELNAIAQAMTNNPRVRARLEGFADNSGIEEANRALSSQRALAVKEQLVARGVAADRIEAVGMGAEQPLTTNETEEGRVNNRRIELVITEL